MYRAQDLALERPCAIKVLRKTTLQRDTEAVASFLAEARSAAALMHPHVVTIHTIGEHRGRHFIEMEYIDGPSLADHVRATCRLEPLDATNFMVQICSALEVAHDKGMVHRDIKPANVMIARSAHAKLADFGLAKRLAKSPGPNILLSGTPSFMAPELFRGKPASKASDVYAVGVTYFSLLTGSLPVAAKSVDDLLKFHEREQSSELTALAPEVSPRIIELVERVWPRTPRSGTRTPAPWASRCVACLGRCAASIAWSRKRWRTNGWISVILATGSKCWSHCPMRGRKMSLSNWSVPRWMLNWSASTVFAAPPWPTNTNSRWK